MPTRASCAPTALPEAFQAHSRPISASSRREIAANNQLVGGIRVKNNMARFDSVECDLGSWDAAQCGCGHGHIGGQRLRRCQLSEQPPLLAHVDVDGEV